MLTGQGIRDARSTVSDKPTRCTAWLMSLPIAFCEPGKLSLSDLPLFRLAFLSWLSLSLLRPVNVLGFARCGG